MPDSRPPWPRKNLTHCPGWLDHYRRAQRGLQARQEIATLAQLGNASFDVTGDAVRFDIELHQALSNDMDHVPEQIGILSHA